MKRLGVEGMLDLLLRVGPYGTQPDQLHPLQQKFLEEAALQCGICTPGFLVAAKALLDRNTNPSETEVRYWLAGNLCRCTGYDKIIRAVMDAAEVMRTQASEVTA